MRPLLLTISLVLSLVACSRVVDDNSNQSGPDPKPFGTPAGDAATVPDTGPPPDSQAVAAADVASPPVRAGWSPVDAPTGESLNAIWGRDASLIVIVGDAGTILERQGSAWVPVPSGTTAGLHAVWGLASGEVYAGGQDGVVLERTAQGWTSLPSPSAEAVSGIWASGPRQLIVVSQVSGTIHHFDGATWTANETTAQGFFSVWGSSATRVFAGGSPAAGSPSFHFDGQTWQEMSQSGHVAEVRAIWGDVNGDVTAVGENTIHTLAGDAIFDGDREGGLRKVFAVWGVSPTQVFVVGENGGVHFWNGRNLQTWPAYTGNTLRGVWGAGLHEVWAVGDGGAILRGTW